MPNPMHPAGLDTLDPCDLCGNLYPLDDMNLIEKYGATHIDDAEQIRVCDDCLGETG